ncbi:hypothetical protein GQ597_09410 [Gilliamella sp. Pra-s65]|uniref:hypothetical protein n=1 Tax=unclassified Gilliamella TaxID=2685620 RepID=UPI00136565F7|nr:MULTISPECIES: hypothetical protein [unclassified Gilliamella]MWN90917.1 hypothetical protein [Gilliamella sp. Pra-s65]MWP74051.1 hypothetical protein [Gilliamella sp. Pra-s52]
MGLFVISQLLGRVNGEFEVICTIQYWPEGKTDSDGNAVFPYMLSYQYQVIHWVESLVNDITTAIK